MKISLCMIVKNEEENIISCLDRALPIVDEVVIVDTGSTDKTKELMIENYKNNKKVKVIDYQWENDFSKARNKSLEYSTGDWIIILDADERVFCDREKLEEFLANCKHLAYKIPIYNVFDKNNITLGSTMIRLYKNKNPKYVGAIHEQIKLNGKSQQGEVLDENICKIYHYGYNTNVFRDKDKSKRNMDIIKSEIEKNPKDPFNWYNKGVMEMIAGNFNSALDDFIKAHELTGKTRMSYHNDLMVRMIQSMVSLKSYNMAIDFIVAISADPYINDMPDIYFYLGICYKELKKYDKAIKSFEKAIEKGEYKDGISKYGMGSFLSLIEWAKVLLLRKDKLAGIEKYKEAAFNVNNVSMVGLDDLKKLLSEENMEDELLKLENDIGNINYRNVIQSNAPEIEEMKKGFKNNIKSLVEQSMLIEAKAAIAEYEDLVIDDVDIYSIKGVIAMIEGNIDEAEQVLKKGLDIQPYNIDMLYNLAYLYGKSNKKEKAIRCFEKAIQNAKAGDDIEEIYEILKQLGITKSKESIIESKEADEYLEVASRLENEGNYSEAALNYGLTYRYTKDSVIKEKLLKQYEFQDVLKEIFDVASKENKKRFIMLSSCGWGDVYQRMHHIARSLARFQHEVIYITPAAAMNLSNYNVDKADLMRNSMVNMKLVENVKIYTPIKVTYNQKEIAENYSELVQYFIDEPNAANEEKVVVTYMPYQVSTIKKLKGGFFHIYECVDDHSDLDYAFWGSKNDVAWEQELMDRADGITTTATSLFLQRRSIEKRKNVYLSRNAVNETDFNYFDNEELPEDLKNIPEPRIVYIGAIYEWFDIDLFYEVVKSNPDKSFVIIGFGKDEIFNKELSNLYLLGHKKHGDLKKYLKFMDIGIIPFKSNLDIIVNCDPIKHYEYLACGLPVITTFMPESGFEKIYTFLANTKESFNEAIDKCLKLKIERKKISNFLAINSWNARAALLCRIANKEIKQGEIDKKLRYIGNVLDKSRSKYNSPIFETLYSLYANIDDNKDFESIMKNAYKKGKTKYIEKQYLTALYLNDKMDTFTDFVMASPYIRKELKKELLYCKNNNKAKCFGIIANICIGDLGSALSIIDNDKKELYLYEFYIKHLLGEKIEIKETCLKDADTESSLYKFLNNNIGIKR